MHSAVSTVGLLAFALLLSGPGLAFLRVLPPIAGFGLLALGGLLGSLAAAGTLGLVASGNGVTWLGLLGLPAALFVLYGVLLGMSVPRINDISTDLEGPPAFLAAHTFPGNAGRDFTFPAANAELIRTSYPALKPLAVNTPADAAFGTVLRLAAEWGPLQQIHVDADTRTLEAFVETPVFRFHDDVVIRVRPLEHGARIDMRSKSRDGQSDFGVNAKRIADFFDRLRAELKEVVL